MEKREIKKDEKTQLRLILFVFFFSECKCLTFDLFFVVSRNPFDVVIVVVNQLWQTCYEKWVRHGRTLNKTKVLHLVSAINDKFNLSSLSKIKRQLRAVSASERAGRALPPYSELIYCLSIYPLKWWFGWHNSVGQLWQPVVWLTVQITASSFFFSFLFYSPSRWPFASSCTVVAEMQLHLVKLRLIKITSNFPTESLHKKLSSINVADVMEIHQANRARPGE